MASNPLTAALPEAIRAFDQEGREVMVPREEWRTNVLPGALKELWDRPDELYSFLLNSLNDGFVAEVTEASAHLYSTDPIAERGTCLWAIVLLSLGRLDEAESVLDRFIAEHGENGAVLINLAKVYASRNEAERADRALWRGLQLEPNLENGLGWFAARAAEAAGSQESGEAAAGAALERVAALPNAWRAKAWLARAELMRGQLAAALPLYREAIARAGQPVPGDLLMSVSGDLGNAGHLRELLELTAPSFDAAAHGLPVGNNLIKAYVDTGELDRADSIARALEAFERPDWKAPLSFWSAEIARRRLGVQSPDSGPAAELEIGMLRVDGPIWLPPGSPARTIFAAKPAGAPAVTFLGGTAEVASAPGQVPSPIAERVGRMSRALPLFFAEQTELRTAAWGRALLPWATGAQSGFVVSGAAWPDATGLEAVGAGQAGAGQNADQPHRSEYLVTVHLDARAEPWTSELVFLRTADGMRIGELEAEWMPNQPENGLLRLADEVVELLSALGRPPSPGAYALPAAAQLGTYLLRLEQLLAVRCAGMPGVPEHFLVGDSQILAGDLELCQAEPASVPARLVFLETLGAMAAIRPEVAGLFRDPFLQLAAEAPLPEVDRAFSAPVPGIAAV